MTASTAFSLRLPAPIDRTASTAVASGSNGGGSVALAVPPRGARRLRGETMVGARAHQGARRWCAVRATVGGAEGRGGENGDGEGEAEGKRGGCEGQYDGCEAWQVARRMYAAVNARDVAGAVACMAEGCEYQDMIYPDALLGKEAVEQHLRRVLHAMPAGVAFVIDDISTGDARACGVTWHAEVNGRPLPFSRGCSFIRCQPENGALRIVFVRDIPEPTFKPGSAALNLLSWAVQLLKLLPASTK